MSQVTTSVPQLAVKAPSCLQARSGTKPLSQKALRSVQTSAWVGSERSKLCQLCVLQIQSRSNLMLQKTALCQLCCAVQLWQTQSTASQDSKRNSHPRTLLLPSHRFGRYASGHGRELQALLCCTMSTQQTLQTFGVASQHVN